MRRLFIGLLVAATTVLLPVWALADNQQVAERITNNLRQHAQLQDYKVGVKFQNGTAWLRGRVASEDQLARTLKAVWATEGVDRVVNQLSIGPSAKAQLKTPKTALRADLVSRTSGTGPQRDSGVMSPQAQRLQQVVDGETSPAEALPATRLAASYVPQPAYPASAMMTAQPAMIPQGVMRPASQPRSNRPVPVAYLSGEPATLPQNGGPVPAYAAPMNSGVAPARYDQPCMPNYSWPSYAAYPNYAAVTYPKQYSATAWPYIGPFYPYPQVPLGWRKVTLEWDDGWWMLDFKDGCCH
jgi:hypothetical protein